MKRIAIIDDEQDARQSLRTMIDMLCPDVEVCGEADSVESAYLLIRQTQPHGLLLDITMNDGSGFDLLDKFPNPPFQVIFTTAHDEFAIKAFRYHVLDYILKPINAEELVQAIDNIKIIASEDYPLRLSNLLESTQLGKLNKITLNSLDGMVFVSLDKIVHLQSEGSYTTFYLLNGEHHLISRPIKDFENLLPSNEFFKVHQSHIVNLTHVKKVLREDGGFVLMENGNKVPIARRRKEDFFRIIRHLFPS